MAIIEIDDVWKRFRIPHERRTTVFDHIAGTFEFLGGKRYSYEEFWALREITFAIEQGESLGIIGPNGSGKSTLLKLILGIMKPERGRISTTGSMAPILELGVGFHPDLTVRENAMIYGVVMGVPRAEMKKRIDSVLDFADLARFQDVALKSLSSGMQVRLGFSIAIQTDADIFLVDEALAVGDMEFQQKCLEKFRAFKKQGKSIVLVSHSMDLIKGFCEKTLYLLKGEARAYGPSETTVTQYIEDVKGAMAA